MSQSKIIVFCVANLVLINVRTRYTGQVKRALPELLCMQRVKKRNADVHTPCYQQQREALFYGHFETNE